MKIAEKNIQTVQNSWFDEFIAAVRTHQLQLETGTANEEIKSVYNVLINGNQIDLAALNKINANQYFVKNMVLEYLKSIQNNMPLKLAFDMDDSEVLIWAEIPNNDEVLENFLLMAEAEVNAKYHKFGYDLTSTIVESNDNLSVPNHYAIFKA